MLLSAQWGGPNGIEAWSLELLLLQCFDTVVWVYWPIKPIPYNVFGGTLNPAQLNPMSMLRSSSDVVVICYVLPILWMALCFHTWPYGVSRVLLSSGDRPQQT